MHLYKALCPLNMCLCLSLSHIFQKSESSLILCVHTICASNVYVHKKNCECQRPEREPC